MRFAVCNLRFTICGVVATAALWPSFAQETNPAPQRIDLPTALRLAGAQNLEVALARERLAEARAQHESTRLQFFPWLSPGIAYRRHDGNTQSTEGDIVDVNKQSYAPGAVFGVQLDLGEAVYRNLAARQLARAADFGLEEQRLKSVLNAAQGYFDLALAQASVEIAREAVAIATNHETQLASAVDAGIAFKGDLLRVRVQVEQNHLALRRAIEQEQVAGSRLAQTLRLNPAVRLEANVGDLTPLSLMDTNRALADFVAQALVSHPSISQSRAFTEAARDAKNGTVYGPMIPSVGAQAFFGGLGGGRNGDTGNFGDQQDYFFGLSWRIGPGGLFDTGRKRTAQARLKSAQLAEAKNRDELTRIVAETYAAFQSAQDRLAGARRALAAAEEGLRLAQERREFGVGIVLENIQAEQDLTRGRQAYANAIADFDKAQFTLATVAGQLATQK
ncbi:MAG: TolC family protein [Verrucomicrobia subdivision 3 bacterium]|nr:TolC family protein [Limisphaerales bacterium]